jgi:hypothetical protein
MVYASMSRKEIFTICGLVLTFIGGITLYRKRFNLASVTFLILGTIIVLTTRPPYIALVVFTVLFSLSIHYHLRNSTKVIAGIALLLFLVPVYASMNIRNLSVRDIVSLADEAAASNFSSTSGAGALVYSVPIAGPLIYYLLAPVPPLNVLKLFSQDGMGIIRSIGSILWFIFFVQSVIRYIELRFTRSYKPTNILKLLLVFFCFLFLAAVITADDPRYKLPCSIFLAMASCIIWYDSRALRVERVRRAASGS